MVKEEGNPKVNSAKAKQAFEFSVYSLVLLAVGLAISAFDWPLFWFVGVIGALPQGLVAAFITLNHRQLSENLSGLIYGSALLLISLACIGLLSEPNLPPPASAAARVLATVAAGGLILQFLIFTVALNWSNSALAWRIRGEKGVVRLLELMDKGNMLVRPDQAARILGQLRDPRAIDALLKATSSENDWLRAEAARALGRIRATQALPALMHLAENDQGRDVDGQLTGKIARKAIKHITKQHKT